MAIHMEMPASSLKAIVGLMQPLTNEVLFTATPSGLSVKAVDPAHVAMVGLEIDKTVIQNFQTEESEKFAMDLTKVMSILKLAGGDENVSIDIDEKLVFKIGNIRRSMLSLDTATMSTPNIPNLSPESHATTQADLLKRAIQAISGIGSEVARLSIKDNVLTIGSQADTQDALMEIGVNDGCEIDSPKDAVSDFPMDYVAKLIPAIPSQYKVRISLNSDFPMLVEFADTGISGKYMIAPRIETE